MENDSRGRGAENIYGGSGVESRKKYGLKRRGKIKYNAVRRGRSTLIAALLQSGRGVFGCRWRRGLWIWGLLMDSNIAPLSSVPRSSGAPRTGGPGPCSRLRQTLSPHPCSSSVVPPREGDPGCPPPSDCLWWVQQRDAPVADPARLRCGAVSMVSMVSMLSMLLHSQQALARKRPQCLTASAHSSGLLEWLSLSAVPVSQAHRH
jgi:hypothetical protein